MSERAALMLALLLTILPAAAGAEEKPLPIIPRPVRADRLTGAFNLNGARLILPASASEAAKTSARIFADKVKARFGADLPVASIELAGPACKGNILLGEAVSLCGRDAELPAGEVPADEGYKLAVKPDGVLIAGSPHGIHNGLATLQQLLLAGDGRSVPAVSILDFPRFPWRGMLLDPARSFLPPDVIKKYIDIFADLKMTRLHWHLVDDQGWRIESKLYPRLHQVGGADGYYTQEQIREIVAYAADRFIEVMPEIDIPGHSSAMLVAYPELACVNAPTAVRKGPGIYSTALCPGKEEVYTFLDGLFGELATLFPAPWVHIGSDEVMAKDWLSYPPNQELMKKENLAGQDGLQSYFVKRVNAILKKHGKTMVAWDEIASYLPEGSVVQAWRKHDFARQAAEAGHYSVVSPTSHCYIDYPQLQFTLKHLYGFEPLPPGLKAGDEKYILGAEVNLWGERVTLANIDRKAFPRVLALAEITWSSRETRDWRDFTARLRPVKGEMKKRGVGFGVTWRDIMLLP
jgi:hexosaminidase